MSVSASALSITLFKLNTRLGNINTILNANIFSDNTGTTDLVNTLSDNLDFKLKERLTVTTFTYIE